MDTRQVATLLKIANEETVQNDFQYIISLNQNIINNLEQELSEDDFTALITENIVVKLSDKSNSDKLLGILIDLKYYHWCRDTNRPGY